MACSTRLEARVECVLEALAARGHAATLHTGESAREAVRAADARSLRVLLLPDRLAPGKLRTLEEGLDPERLGNLLVTTIDRSAPEMAERIEAFARVALQARPKRPPVMRMREPTPVPPKSRKWAAPIVVAAGVVAVLVVALQYGLRPREREAIEQPPAASEASVAAPATVAPASNGADAEPQAEAIEVSVPMSDDEIEIFEIDGQRKRVKKPRSSEAEAKPVPSPSSAPTTRPIADAPALGPTSPLRFGLAPMDRHDAAPPGEEQDLR